MKEKKEEVLSKWLEIEFYSIASKWGFMTTEKKADKTLILETIRCLDNETCMKPNINKNYVIGILGLMWEHINHEEYDIRPLMIKFLSRIGYPTSAIIADKQFDKKTCSFNFLYSVIDEISSTINQSKNEINIAGQEFLMTDFQMDIWDKMNKQKIVGISAPTSAGKSFVILLNIMKKLTDDCFDIVYIVPTLSLVNQVTEDFNRLFRQFSIKDYFISNSYIAETCANRNVYILTQERAIAAFSSLQNAFERSLILVVDEIQNIERIHDEQDERAKALFDSLVEFRYKDNVKQIIIAGPRIGNIDTFGQEVFGEKVSNCSTDESPVLNITYSVQKYGKKYYLKQYSSLKDDPIIHEIINASSIKDYGKKQYSDSFMKYLNETVKLIGGDSQNIIFAPTAATARKIAVALENDENNKLDSLINYYGKTIHPEYSLCRTLKKGIAYHHGKLPMHVRRTLEKAISDKSIHTVVCTTTLMQGVNLPAQNVFIRNPHLYVRRTKSATELSNYEMANLRGRAGRLLKDFVGRTFVLDEDEFSSVDGYEQKDLFDDVKKDLPSSYEEKFEDFKLDIEDAVTGAVPVNDDMHAYGYLVSYIRQTVLRYGNESKVRLSNIGIKLSKEQIAAIIYKLNELEVPREICMQNRYWDPYILDYIYKHFQGKLPDSVLEVGARNNISDALRFMSENDVTRVMFEKYIPERYRKGNRYDQLLTLTVDWASGKSLNKIIENNLYGSEEIAEKIDEIISLLQNTISYSLPMLMKPIFDIKNANNILMTSLQTGATDNITISMIQLGIPRETAIYLRKKLSFTDENGLGDTAVEVKKTIKNSYADLPYWIQIQLEFLN